MHSISTSVFLGRVLTATHLYQVSSYSGYPSKEESNIRPARLDISPVLHINRVHVVKVVHIRDEDVDLHNLGNIRSCRFEDMR